MREFLTGCDHPKACNTAFTAKRLKWLFGQKRAATYTHASTSDIMSKGR